MFGFNFAGRRQPSVASRVARRWKLRKPTIEFLEDRRMLSGTFPVTNTNDSGIGSLRAEILLCNAANGGTVTFGNTTGTDKILTPLPTLGNSDAVVGNRLSNGFASDTFVVDASAIGAQAVVTTTAYSTSYWQYVPIMHAQRAMSVLPGSLLVATWVDITNCNAGAGALVNVAATGAFVMQGATVSHDTGDSFLNCQGYSDFTFIQANDGTNAFTTGIVNATVPTNGGLVMNCDNFGSLTVVAQVNGTGFVSFDGDQWSNARLAAKLSGTGSANFYYSSWTGGQTAISALGLNSLSITNGTVTGNAGNPAVLATNTSLTVTNTAFASNASTSLALQSSTASVSNSTFGSDTGMGITAQGGSLALSGITFSLNNGTCISTVGTSVSDSGSTYTGNGGNVMVSVVGAPSADFENGTLTNNTATTDFLCTQTAGGETTTINHWTVTGNTGVQYNLTGFAGSQTDYNNNTSTNNPGVGVVFSGPGAGVTPSTFNATNDVFNGQGNSAMQFSSGYYTLTGITAENGYGPGAALVYENNEPTGDLLGQLTVNNSSFTNNVNTTGSGEVVDTTWESYWNYCTFTGNSYGMKAALANDGLLQIMHSNFSSNGAINLDITGTDLGNGRPLAFVNISSTNFTGSPTAIQCIGSISSFNLGIFDTVITGNLVIHISGNVNIFN